MPLSNINRRNKMDYHRLSEALFIFFGCLGKSEPIYLLCHKSQHEKYWHHLRPQLERNHNFSSDNLLPVPSSSSLERNLPQRAKLCASLGARWHTDDQLRPWESREGNPGVGDRFFLRGCSARHRKSTLSLDIIPQGGLVLNSKG